MSNTSFLDFGTYYIIGGDGKEYGPINVQELIRLGREGQITPFTKIRNGGIKEWRSAHQFRELGFIKDVLIEEELGRKQQQQSPTEVIDLKEQTETNRLESDSSVRLNFSSYYLNSALPIDESTKHSGEGSRDGISQTRFRLQRFQNQVVRSSKCAPYYCTRTLILLTFTFGVFLTSALVVMDHLLQASLTFILDLLVLRLAMQVNRQRASSTQGLLRKNLVLVLVSMCFALVTFYSNIF